MATLYDEKGDVRLVGTMTFSAIAVALYAIGVMKVRFSPGLNGFVGWDTLIGVIDTAVANMSFASEPPGPNRWRFENDPGFECQYGLWARIIRLLSASGSGYWFPRGTVFVAAAGNSTIWLDSLSEYRVSPPNLPHVISVGATNHQGYRSPWQKTFPLSEPQGQNTRDFWFSNWGDQVDLSAPGSAIFTTDYPGVGFGYSAWAFLPVWWYDYDGLLWMERNPGGDIWWDGWGSPSGDDYVHVNGTSLSAPLVSGVVALFLSVHPDFWMLDPERWPDQVEDQLKQSATYLGPDPVFGITMPPLVNAEEALVLR